MTLGETTPEAILGATRIEGLLRWRENSFGLDDIPQDDPNYSADDRAWFGYLRSETALFGGALSLSVLVWFAAKDGKKFWLFPLAILLHLFVDAVAVILKGSGANNWLIAANNVILVVVANNAAAFNGVSGGTAPGSTDPNANFSY